MDSKILLSGLVHVMCDGWTCDDCRTWFPEFVSCPLHEVDNQELHEEFKKIINKLRATHNDTPFGELEYTIETDELISLLKGE